MLDATPYVRRSKVGFGVAAVHVSLWEANAVDVFVTHTSGVGVSVPEYLYLHFHSFECTISF